jgi:hypothetical protein
MSKRIRLVVVAVVALSEAVVLLVQSTAPSIGTWKVDLAKSTYSELTLSSLHQPVSSRLAAGTRTSTRVLRLDAESICRRDVTEGAASQ